MPTYYKPSQWRGKHLAYRSTDPHEPTREIARTIKVALGGIISLAIIWLLSRWFA
jgi:hypothetical protein